MKKPNGWVAVVLGISCLWGQASPAFADFSGDFLESVQALQSIDGQPATDPDRLQDTQTPREPKTVEGVDAWCAQYRETVRNSRYPRDFIPAILSMMNGGLRNDAAIRYSLVECALLKEARKGWPYPSYDPDEKNDGVTALVAALASQEDFSALRTLHKELPRDGHNDTKPHLLDRLALAVLLPPVEDFSRSWTPDSTRRSEMLRLLIDGSGEIQPADLSEMRHKLRHEREKLFKDAFSKLLQGDWIKNQGIVMTGWNFSSVLEGVGLVFDADLADKTRLFVFPKMNGYSLEIVLREIVHHNSSPDYFSLLTENEQARLVMSLVKDTRLKREQRGKLITKILKRAKPEAARRIIAQAKGDSEYGSLYIIAGLMSDDPVLMQKKAVELPLEDQITVIQAMSVIPFKQANVGRVIGTLFLSVGAKDKKRLADLILGLKGPGWFDILTAVSFTDMKGQLAPLLEPKDLASIVADLRGWGPIEKANPEVDNPEATIGRTVSSGTTSGSSHAKLDSDVVGGKITVSAKGTATFGTPGIGSASVEMGVAVEGSYSHQWQTTDTTNSGTTNGETLNKGELARYWGEFKHWQNFKRLFETKEALDDYARHKFDPAHLKEYDCYLEGRCKWQ